MNDDDSGKLQPQNAHQGQTCTQSLFTCFRSECVMEQAKRAGSDGKSSPLPVTPRALRLLHDTLASKASKQRLGTSLHQGVNGTDARSVLYQKK